MDTQGFRIRVPWGMWVIVALATLVHALVLIVTGLVQDWPGLVLVAGTGMICAALPVGFYCGSAWGREAARGGFAAGTVAGRLAAANDPNVQQLRHHAHIAGVRIGALAPDEVEPCSSAACLFCRERDSAPVIGRQTGDEGVSGDGGTTTSSGAPVGGLRLPEGVRPEDVELIAWPTTRGRFQAYRHRRTRQFLSDPVPVPVPPWAEAGSSDQGAPDHGRHDVRSDGPSTDGGSPDGPSGHGE